MSAVALKEFASQGLLCDICEGIPEHPGTIVTEARSHPELIHCMECLFVRMIEESEGALCPCCREPIVKVEMDCAKKAQIEQLMQEAAGLNYASRQVHTELTVGALKELEGVFGIDTLALADRVGVPLSITYPLMFDELQTSFARPNNVLPSIFKQFERDCKKTWAFFPAFKTLSEGLFIKDQRGAYETDWGLFTLMFCQFIEKVGSVSGKSDSPLCQFFSRLDREMSERDVDFATYARV